MKVYFGIDKNGDRFTFKIFFVGIYITNHSIDIFNRLYYNFRHE